MKYKVTLNSRTYEVEVEDGQAMLLDEYEAYAPTPAAAAAPAAPAAAAAPAPAAANAASVIAGEAINSPMPGTILKVNVGAGEAIKSGQVLVVLEAMKMENEILAPRDGIVAQVIATKGSTVDTGAPLLVIA